MHWRVLPLPMAVAGGTSWVRISAVLAVATAAISVTAFFSVSSCRRKSWRLVSSIRVLEASLKSSIDKAAAERRGRVRAQQDLRKALTQHSLEGLNSTSTNAYPMSPIGVVHSCFTTRWMIRWLWPLLTFLQIFLLLFAIVG